MKRIISTVLIWSLLGLNSFASDIDFPSSEDRYKRALMNYCVAKVSKANESAKMNRVAIGPASGLILASGTAVAALGYAGSFSRNEESKNLGDVAFNVGTGFVGGGAILGLLNAILPNRKEYKLENVLKETKLIINLRNKPESKRRQVRSKK